MKNPSQIISYFLVLALLASTCAVFFVMWKYNDLYTSIQSSLIEAAIRPPKKASSNPTIEKYASDDWKAWESSEYIKSVGKELSMRLLYPRDFEVSAPFLQFPKEEWAKAPIGSIAFPADAFSNEGKNDFREARMEIFSSSDKTSVACSKKEWDFAKTKSATLLSGIEFNVATWQEGAAGSFYKTESYATKIGATCLKINLIASNVNRDNYDTPQEYKQIDPERPLSILRTILRTASFTPSSQ